MRPVRLARISNPYGVPGPYAAGVHTGVDFAAVWGTAIFGRRARAVLPGVVIVSGRDDSYGNWVVVRSTFEGNTFVHGYCHLFSRAVRLGARVRRGQVLGRVGNSGNSTGSHLHYFENPGPIYSYRAHRRPRHCYGRTWAQIRALRRR